MTDQPTVAALVEADRRGEIAHTSSTRAPEDRCTLSEGCDAPYETTIVGWAGGSGWVFDACWPCAKHKVDVMSGWAL